MTVRTLANAATDHMPMVAAVPLQRPRQGIKHISRRNYRNISSNSLLHTLKVENLSRVFFSDNVEVIHKFIVEEITIALDELAPVKTTVIKDRDTPLYLRPDMLGVMRERDKAASASNVDDCEIKQTSSFGGTSLTLTRASL